MSGARKMAIPAAGPVPSIRSPMRTRSSETTASRLSVGTGAAPSSPAWATVAGPSAMNAAITATRSMIHSSRVHVVVGLEHLVGRCDDLGVHLIGTLGGDQVGHLDHRVDVRLLEVALLNVAVAVLHRQTVLRRAGRRRFHQ